MYNTILTARYNHSKFMQEAQEGQQLIDNIPVGKELQKYQVGDKVKMYNHGDTIATILDVNCDNGYFVYTVEYKLKPRARKVYSIFVAQKNVIAI